MSPTRLLRALAGDRKVIVRRPKAEMHGYLVEAGDRSAKVLWSTGSGRQRTKVVTLEQLRLPDPSTPWEGVEIPRDLLPVATLAAA